MFLKYQLIINCEANNKITKKFFYKKLKKDYNSYAYTTIIEHNKIPKNNIATQTFTKKGPIAFLPISNKETSIVYSIKGEKKIEVADLIRKFNIKYKINKINKINCFKLKSSNLRSYYYKNILAFGDLLHKIHPLAGQGANIGFADAKDLSQLIKQSCLEGTSLGCREVLNQYQSSRRRDNFSTAALMEIFARGFSSSHPTVQWLRNEGMNFVDHSGLLKKIIAKNKSNIKFPKPRVYFEEWNDPLITCLLYTSPSPRD